MPKRKASFYGVRVGKQPGVYDDWDVCKVQVLGFSGSEYKGFSTRAEAENYVKDCLTESQNIAVPPKTEILENTNLDEICKLPIATSKKHTIQPCLQKVRTLKDITSPLYPLTRVATSKEEVTSPFHPLTRVTIPNEEVTSPEKLPTKDPLTRVTTPKEEVTSPEQLSTKDQSNYFKLVEENGQRFVVFESIEKFDSYFEGLCRTRHLRKSGNLKTSCRNQETSSQEQPSDSSQDIQTKVAVEDDEFVYFKDEDELKSFLEPYFKNAKHNPPGPAQVYQSFDGVAQASSFAQQDPSEPLQLHPNLDAVQGVSFIAHQGIYQIEFDGASKGNPGRAGAGALIRCPHGSVVVEMTEFLGIETNNVAEYRALILGLKVALSKGMRRVRAQGDSKLVCLQVTGAWRVEKKKLISLHEEVKRLENMFEVFSIVHIRREYNSAADALANEAVYLGEPAREVAKPTPECCL